MKQLFLTSTVADVAFHIGQKIDIEKNKRLLFIYTPTETRPGGRLSPWNDKDRKSLVTLGFDVLDFTITGKGTQEIADALNQANVIYVSGGDTYHLLKQAQATGFVEIIQDQVCHHNKIYVGTSAGSLIAGPICPDYLIDDSKIIGTKQQSAFDFVNFCIMPHWGSIDFENKYLNHRLAVAYKEMRVPLLALTDTQYVHVIDDNMEIIDVAKNE